MRFALVALLALFAAPAAAQSATPLYPFLEYCWRTRDPGCVVDRVTPQDLALINLEITDAITTREDPDYCDPWTPFPADRMGDCDDDAATKRAALLALGMNPKAMHFETGEADGQRHVVLVVTIAGRDYVMDRKTPDRVYSPDKRPYKWRPLAAQSFSGPLWKEPQ